MLLSSINPILLRWLRSGARDAPAGCEVSWLMADPLDAGAFVGRAGFARAYAELEARLAQAPDDLALRRERAACLQLLGRPHDALSAYLAILADAPADAGALRGAGDLLAASMPEQAAAAARERGRTLSPRPGAPHGVGRSAGRRGRRGGRSRAVRGRARGRGLCSGPLRPRGLLEASGDPAAAHAQRHRGWAARPLVLVPSTGPSEPVPVLLLGTAFGANQVTADYLDPERFATFALLVDYFPPTRPLPRHDVVFNGVCDADASPEALAAASHLLRRTDAPVINDPRTVAATGRADVARRFANVPGVRTPRIVRTTRAALERADAAGVLAEHGVRAPLLLRAPGFHAGEHFAHVAGAADLVPVVRTLPGDEFFALEFLESRDPDGLYRKYRVMAIDGALHPVHVAIAPHWKVHLFSAGMDGAGALRAEDAAFLADMRGTLGDGPMRASKRSLPASASTSAPSTSGLAATSPCCSSRRTPLRTCPNRCPDRNGRTGAPT